MTTDPLDPACTWNPSLPSGRISSTEASTSDDVLMEAVVTMEMEGIIDSAGAISGPYTRWLVISGSMTDCCGTSSGNT